ncbi:unnamed protein product [Natator depressus]
MEVLKLYRTALTFYPVPHHRKLLGRTILPSRNCCEMASPWLCRMDSERDGFGPPLESPSGHISCRLATLMGVRERTLFCRAEKTPPTLLEQTQFLSCFRAWLSAWSHDFISAALCGLLFGRNESGAYS